MPVAIVTSRAIRLGCAFGSHFSGRSRLQFWQGRRPNLGDSAVASLSSTSEPKPKENPYEKALAGKVWETKPKPEKPQDILKRKAAEWDAEQERLRLKTERDQDPRRGQAREKAEQLLWNLKMDPTATASQVARAQAIEAKQLLLAKDLMSTLATLQKAHTAHQLRRGALVDAHTLEGWAREIGTAVMEELEGVYGREEICDRLAVRFAAILGAAKQEQATRVQQ